LLFLCPRREVKGWIDWDIEKIRDKHIYQTLEHGDYVTLYIHIVRVHNSNLIIPYPRIGGEFVVKNRIRPRAIVPIRVSWNKRIDLSKVNSTLKRLNEIKMKV